MHEGAENFGAKENMSFKKRFDLSRLRGALEPHHNISQRGLLPPMLLAAAAAARWEWVGKI